MASALLISLFRETIDRGVQVRGGIVYDNGDKYVENECEYSGGIVYNSGMHHELKISLHFFLSYSILVVLVVFFIKIYF